MNTTHSPLVAQLAAYAGYHRDQRNIATHFIGVPLIVFAVTALLSRPAFEVAGLTLSPVSLIALAAAGFYLRLDLRLGLVMSTVLALSAWGASLLAAQSTAVWLAVSVGVFVIGWAIQFLGHAWEGKKPAFVDDLIGLLVGPLFVTAELGFAMGLRLELKAEVERLAGPTRVGRLDGQRTA